jgi:hypothetical protein
MRHAFAGALCASAILHAGLLLAPAPWIGERLPEEGMIKTLSVNLKGLPDMRVADTQHVPGVTLDSLPSENLRQDSSRSISVSPVFYKASELDKAALPLSDIPELAMLVTDPKRQWRMRARLFIDDKGRAVKVELARDQTVTPALAEAVSSTLRTLTFAPAIKDGQAVASQKLMDIVIGGEP